MTKSEVINGFEPHETVWYPLRKFKHLAAAIVMAITTILTLGGGTAQAATCTVPFPYTSIQAAVNNSSCTTINVAAGPYFENVTIPRTLTLNGAQAGNPVSTRVSGSPLESTVNGANPIGNNSVITINAPGVIIGTGFVRCGRGTQIPVPGMAGTQNIDALCAATPGGFKPNALFLGPNGLPVADPEIRVIGDPHPKYTMSYSTSFKILNKVTLSGLLDVKKGGTQYDGTRGALYVFGTHKDTDRRGGTEHFSKSHPSRHR